VLRKILGPERVKVTGNWRKMHNEDVHDMYCPDIGEKIKKNEMKETCSIQGERRGEDRVEVGKSE